MRTPPLLIGAALLFWGWQTGFLAVGAAMAVVVESARVLKVRWEFSGRDFNRIWDFCSGLFLVLAAYSFTANEGPGAVRDLVQGFMAPRPAAALKTARAALTILQWLPMIFLPLVAAQLFSHRDQVPLSTFWLRRRQARQKHPAPQRGLNVVYPYFAVCLGSASITAREDLGFFAGLCMLLGWALWFQRSRRFSALAWASAVGAAVALGYLGQINVQNLQRYLENFNADWVLNWRRKNLDMPEARTAIGRIGRLKLSGRIVLRVKPRPGDPPPLLLREASYRKFTSPVWRGIISREEYGTVLSETDTTTWLLLPEKKPVSAVNIGGYLEGGRGLLALPNGTARLENLGVFTLKTNRLGVVLVDSGPGLVVFDAIYGPGRTLDTAPTEEDREVPEKEDAAISSVAAQLNLAGKKPDEVLDGVKDFFRQKFSYRTWLDGPALSQPGRTPLGTFLLESRAGHCEYFATATVLLLRKLGLPARYAVGYVVDEKSGGAYLVRERHAHAWTLVYHHGRWHNFDTTPDSWIATELNRASIFQPISDALSRLWFEFNRWRWGQTSLRKYILWVLGPVLLVLILQLFLRKEWKRLRQKNLAPVQPPLWPGMDSEFYLVAQRLAACALPRRPGEPMSGWLDRLRADASLDGQLEQLRPMLALHYRYRFDPEGINPEERDRLRLEARHCLDVLAPRKSRRA